MKFKTVSVIILMIAVLMMICIGCERKVINESNGDLVADASACFTCHSDQDRDLRAATFQWQVSKHASGDNIDRNRINASFYQPCEKCHTSEGFLASLEGGSASGEYFTQIGCFTCHAPHTNTNLEVRVQQAVALMNGFSFDRGSANICASCHQSRANIDELITDDTELDLRWGPHHSNHADMLAGTNAYEYGLDIGNSAHTNVAQNGCVECHMSASGDITLGGHSWKMYDEAKDHYNVTGCNVEACHGANAFSDGFGYPADADYDWDGDDEETVEEEVAGLLDSLETLLVDAGMLEDQHPTDVTVSADSAGAVFNWLFVYEDRSMGAHNTDYAVGLLQAAINFLTTGDPEGAPVATKPKDLALINR
jgi:hypothetical protein